MATVEGPLRGYIWRVRNAAYDVRIMVDSSLDRISESIRLLESTAIWTGRPLPRPTPSEQVDQTDAAETRATASTTCR